MELFSKDSFSELTCLVPTNPVATVRLLGVELRSCEGSVRERYKLSLLSIRSFL